ncbi:hypothetical protein QM565_10195 [Geitlerinema splendidum]|nr:hypothetical protein [Geitlerinema splendidum]
MTRHPFELGFEDVLVAQATTQPDTNEQESQGELVLTALEEIGERWRFTQAVGENGHREGFPLPERIADPFPITTMAVGEEGGWDNCLLDNGNFRSWRSWCDRPNVGESEDNPFLPDIIEDSGNGWWFERVPSGQWFDPPTTFGFGYEMQSDSLFTEILGFPTGFDSPFTVSVGDRVLGQFSPGQAVSFLDTLGWGVSHFTVTGISPTVDLSDPTAFPLQIAFSTQHASFRMYGIERPDSAAVPESAPVWGLLFLCAIAIFWKRGTPLS